MKKLALIFTCTALLFGGCAANVDPDTSSQQQPASASLESADVSEPGMRIDASSGTQDRFGIANWRAERLEASAAVEGLNEAGEPVFAFELEGGEQNVTIIGRDTMPADQAQMVDAYLADMVQAAHVAQPVEELVSKGDPQQTTCDTCGYAPVKFSCYGVLLMCQDKKWCSNPEWWEPRATSCGSQYVCGGCIGLSW